MTPEEPSPFACPCGEPHHITPYAAGLIRDKGAQVTVTTADGSWRVPRIWVAVHGLASVDLPALAEQYGWPRG